MLPKVSAALTQFIAPVAQNRIKRRVPGQAASTTSGEGHPSSPEPALSPEAPRVEAVHAEDEPSQEFERFDAKKEAPSDPKVAQVLSADEVDLDRLRLPDQEPKTEDPRALSPTQALIELIASFRGRRKSKKSSANAYAQTLRRGKGVKALRKGTMLDRKVE